MSGLPPSLRIAARRKAAIRRLGVVNKYAAIAAAIRRGAIE